MAAIVTGLVRLFQPSLASMGECQGPVLWYALLSLRLVALFTADSPWSSIKPDFTCNQTVSDFCKTLCFNEHFNVPVSSLWSFSFLAAVVPVLLMRMIQRGSSPVTLKKKKKDIEMMEPVKEASYGTPSVSMQQSLCVVLPYVACILFLLAIELVFLWVLMAVQLPTVYPRSFSCRPSPCRGELHCAIMARTEKQMALATLAFTAAVNVLVCVTSVVLEITQLSKCRKK